MFKKLTVLLTPFVLVPFGSLLTPTVARADYSYPIQVQKCEFCWHDYTSWSGQIAVRSKDNAAHLTQIQFGYGNTEKIRQLQLWESRKLNGQETTYSKQTYTFNPGITNWSDSVTTTWISTAGDRYINVWLYNEDGRTCTSKVKF